MHEHLTDEQLILHYYGEPQDVSAAAALETCEQCRSEYQRLQLVLNSVDGAPVPHRGPEYSAAVWSRIGGRVGSSRGWWRMPSRWVAAAAMTAMLAIAFYAGRATQPVGSGGGLAAGAVRERILLVAVGDHLERSQIMLVELLNSNPGDALDTGAAEGLIQENRLYRQTAIAGGEPAVAQLLDDLERVLLEIAHSPGQLSSGGLEEIRQRIEKEGLLFRVRVVESRMEQEQGQPLPDFKTKI